MNKDFSARTCPLCEATDITAFGDNKRVFICANPLCAVAEKCNTTFEENFEAMQYPLRATSERTP